MRMIGKLSAGFAALALFAAADAAYAQTPPADENGRYTLSAIDNGYLRLDTRTGAVSVCTPKGGWTCRVVPDERVALDQEIGRLQGQVDTLKTQLANRNDTVKGKIDEPLAKTDSLKGDVPEKSAANGEAGRKPAGAAIGKDAATGSQTSSQQKLTAALDRVWQHLIEIAVRVQKRISENI
ncbi:hypothetical protein AFIC_002933 [[Pseudomonas] carboxydohydrogena]|uniref:Lipoprotein n=1 Tax=Afipia carboxydohydrogena TaxID=290 RepID=A0ABY8BNT2_AFICR|nr:hypothetical protein [[Pseudomonas] carboxydohydrogena]WEF51349.1 hypothetical protein AFIC_002933 [[Pseudomonas] carboxydohydrogena]